MAEKTTAELMPIAPFEKEITSYLREVTALRTSYPVVMALLRKTRQHSEEQMGEQIKKGRPRATLTEENPIVELDRKSFKKLRVFADENTRLLDATRIISRSFIVALVSQWDAFFSSILRIVITLLPEEARGVIDHEDGSKDSKPLVGSLTYLELCKFKTLEDAKVHLVDKRVGAVLRKSHTEQIEWLENRIKKPNKGDFSMRKGEEWKYFIEITQRRHLYVHTNGVVTADYINECEKAKVPLQREIKVDDIIQTSDDYFFEASRRMYEMGLMLATVVWRKLRAESKADLAASEQVFNSLCVELIGEGDFDCALRLLSSATTEWREYGSEEIKNYLRFNHAQALKVGWQA